MDEGTEHDTNTEDIDCTDKVARGMLHCASTVSSSSCLSDSSKARLRRPRRWGCTSSLDKPLLSVAAGAMTAVCTAEGQLFTCGVAGHGRAA